VIGISRICNTCEEYIPSTKTFEVEAISFDKFSSHTDTYDKFVNEGKCSLVNKKTKDTNTCHNWVGKKVFEIKEDKMNILNVTNRQLFIEEKEAGIFDLTGRDEEVLRALLHFDEIPELMDLDKLAVAIVEHLDSLELKTKRVLINDPPFLMPYLEFRLLDNGYNPYYPFYKNNRFAGLVNGSADAIIEESDKEGCSV